MTLLISGGIAILVIVSLALIVRALLHKGRSLGWQEILAIYFYLVSIISLLAVVVGGATMTKALLSNAFGRDFSYQSNVLSSPQPASIGSLISDQKMAQQQKAEEEAVAQRERQRIELEYQDDLFTGVSTLIVGLLFLAVHMIGWRTLHVGDQRNESFWYRGYILLQLIMYGLIVLVALPLAISQTLRFFIITGASNMPQPGDVLSVAVWAMPAWIVFVWLALRMNKKQSLSA